MKKSVSSTEKRIAFKVTQAAPLQVFFVRNQVLQNI